MLTSVSARRVRKSSSKGLAKCYKGEAKEGT